MFYQALITALCWSLCVYSSVAAAPPSGFKPKRASIVHLTLPIIIDGKLDEAAWSQATRITDFVQFGPGDGDPPTEPTEFYVAFDDDNLYIGARLTDSAPEKIKHSQLVQGQGVFNDDYIQILLDPYHNLRTGYIFYLNPNGVQRDGLLLGGMQFNMEWDGIWAGASQLDAQGWSAEVAIPFKTLAFDPKADVWGLNLVRSIRRNREELAWSQRARRVTLDLGGEIQGIAGRDQGLGLDLTPSLAFSERQNFKAAQSRLAGKPSLDAYYRITPSLGAALTLNTDFSATEVDDRQVNLTRFSPFFPEKRDFFLEDSEIFEFGGLTQNGRPFFSRTIGLSAAGQPIDLDAGLRLTGKLGRLSVGALAVRQADAVGLGAQDLFVGRGYMTLGDQVTIGAIATSGDPTLGRSNNLVGADFAWRTNRLVKDRQLEARLWTQQSDTINIQDEDSAWGASLNYPNDRFESLLSYTRIGKNFKPALGFVNRTNIEEFTARSNYRYRFDRGGIFRSWLGRIGVQQVNNLDGRLESRMSTFTPVSLETQPGDSVSLEFMRFTEVPSQNFSLPGNIVIRAGRYEFDRLRLYGATAGFRELFFTYDMEAGDFYTGSRLDTRVGVNWKPSPHLLLASNYQTNNLKLSNERYKTELYSLTANIAFNVRWAWLNVVQYDNVSARLGLNSRFRWLPTPGQAAYLVLNYDWRENYNGDFKPYIAETTLKFNYTFRY